MSKRKAVYSVRRARKNLLDAIRWEQKSFAHPFTRHDFPLPHARYIATRERAIRDLIASVRAEKQTPKPRKAK